LAEGGHLPKETLNYVPKFLAIASICSYPGRNGLPVSWETQEEWERIRVVKPVDIRLLADAADVPLDILKAGNAELIYWITPHGRPPLFPEGPASYSDSIERVLSSDAFTPLNSRSTRSSRGTPSTISRGIME
jgi:membrane-bound lytic murein transglycosylase D